MRPIIGTKDLAYSILLFSVDSHGMRVFSACTIFSVTQWHDNENSLGLCCDLKTTHTREVSRGRLQPILRIVSWVSYPTISVKALAFATRRAVTICSNRCSMPTGAGVLVVTGTVLAIISTAYVDAFSGW